MNRETRKTAKLDRPNGNIGLYDHDYCRSKYKGTVYVPVTPALKRKLAAEQVHASRSKLETTCIYTPMPANLSEEVYGNPQPKKCKETHDYDTKRQGNGSGTNFHLHQAEHPPNYNFQKPQMEVLESMHNYIRPNGAIAYAQWQYHGRSKSEDRIIHLVIDEKTGKCKISKPVDDTCEGIRDNMPKPGQETWVIEYTDESINCTLEVKETNDDSIQKVTDRPTKSEEAQSYWTVLPHSNLIERADCATDHVDCDKSDANTQACQKRGSSGLFERPAINMVKENEGVFVSKHRDTLIKKNPKEINVPDKGFKTNVNVNGSLRNLASDSAEHNLMHKNAVCLDEGEKDRYSTVTNLNLKTGNSNEMDISMDDKSMSASCHKSIQKNASHVECGKEKQTIFTEESQETNDWSEKDTLTHPRDYTCDLAVLDPSSINMAISNIFSSVYEIS